MPISIRQIARETLRRLIADPGPKGPSTVGQAPGNMVGDAPVTISIAQLDELRAQIRAAHADNAALEARLAEAKSIDPRGRVVQLNELVRQMLVIVRFAIANLPPSEIPKWPWTAVDSLAAGLSLLPDCSVDDATLASELKLFVDEIKEHEMDRSRRQAALIADAPSFAPPPPTQPAKPPHKPHPPYGRRRF